MYKIGIDIGGMSVKAGLVDELGNITGKSTMVTPLNSNSELANCIICLVKEVLAKTNKTIDEISSIGIGSPGIINTLKGEIVYASNLGIEHFEVVKAVKDAFNVDCFVENDANCAVLGEYYFGSAKGVENVVMFTLGTGVGTGFIVNGKMLVSPKGGGTEGGHMIVVIDGKQCACGGVGCYEKYASASALIELTKEAIRKNPNSLLKKASEEEGEVNGKVVFNAVRQNDKVAKEVLNTYIKYVASGMINIINVFRPELILVGGGLSNQKELLIEPLAEYVNNHVFGSKYLDKIEIKQAKLKNDAGILGAAMLGVN